MDNIKTLWISVNFKQKWRVYSHRRHPNFIEKCFMAVNAPVFSKSDRLLGFIYLNGWGVPQDHQEAAKWFRKAVEHCDNDSKYYLGSLPSAQ